MSVLISTYAGEQADRLQLALMSIVTQTMPPHEVVIVLDGPVDPDQERVIEQISVGHREIEWRIIRLPLNVGLGSALNAGLVECHGEWVARMDSDDISVSDRLEAQASFLASHPEVDLVAGWQAEFEDDPELVVRIKRTPELHGDIVRRLIWRNVISHPTIMFRREAVARIGGYRPILYLEDYDLYMRLIACGARFHAVQRPLVRVRTDPRQYRRRGGIAHLAAELQFRRDCYRRRNLTFIEFATSLIAYSVFRIIPTSFRRASYLLVREGPSAKTPHAHNRLGKRGVRRWRFRVAPPASLPNPRRQPRHGKWHR